MNAVLAPPDVLWVAFAATVVLTASVLVALFLPFYGSYHYDCVRREL